MRARSFARANDAKSFAVGMRNAKLGNHLNKRKSLRLQQPARAYIIHSNREIKEISDPEKLTLSINSEHKSA